MTRGVFAGVLAFEVTEDFEEFDGMEDFEALGVFVDFAVEVTVFLLALFSLSAAASTLKTTPQIINSITNLSSPLSIIISIYGETTLAMGGFFDYH